VLLQSACTFFKQCQCHIRRAKDLFTSCLGTAFRSRKLFPSELSHEFKKFNLKWCRLHKKCISLEYNASSGFLAKIKTHFCGWQKTENNPTPIA